MRARRAPWRVAAALAVVLLALVLVACGGEEAAEERPRPAPAATAPEEAPPPELTFTRVDASTVGAYGATGDDDLGPWRDAVGRVEDVRIPSTADDHQQPAVWLPPRGEGPRPLLVVVHSWSNEYLQAANVPFAEWADANDWAMIAPNFRGVFETPEATGSDLAVQDVIDSVDFAVDRAEIDERRVFVIGFSGGGMMSLLMAGRHPDRFAGAAAWVPVYDLVDWFAHSRAEQPDRDYADQIRASCGGDPTAAAGAREECEHRSPSAHLNDARAARIPVYIAHGVDDTNVPPDHGARAFNQLADAGDRLAGPVLEALRQNRVPGRLEGTRDAREYFRGPDPDVVFSRSSGPVTLVLFDGDHDAAYNPGLEWITQVARGP